MLGNIKWIGLLSWILLLILSARCSSTEQIQTAPPRPVTPQSTPVFDAEPRAILTIIAETGETALPPDVAMLRFRIVEILLKQKAGTWTSYPADVNNFEIRSKAPRIHKTLLSTRIQPGSYDRMAIVLANIYVEYNANSGAPLTVTGDDPLELPIDLQSRMNQTSTVTLKFEPGVSLSRDPNGRWSFLPHFVPTVSTRETN